MTTDTKEKVLTLKEALTLLDEAVINTMQFFEKIDKNDLPHLLRSYKLLDENKDVLDGLQKVLDAVHRKMSYEVIPTAFADNGIDSMKLSGRNFIVSSRLNASIPVANREAAHTWLKENNLSELIQPNVNAKTLASAASAYFEEHAKFFPESIFTIHRQPYTQMRKA